MDAGSRFCGRVLEAIECLASLRRRHACPNEQLAGRYRERSCKLRGQDGIELACDVEQQAAIQGQRQGRRRVSPFLWHMALLSAKGVPHKKPGKYRKWGSRNEIFVSTSLSRPPFRSAECRLGAGFRRLSVRPRLLVPESA